MTRHIARTVYWIVVGAIVDVLEASAALISIAALTLLIGMVLPVAASFVIAMLSVCVCFGYRRARLLSRTSRGRQAAAGQAPCGGGQS